MGHTNGLVSFLSGISQQLLCTKIRSDHICFTVVWTPIILEVHSGLVSFAKICLFQAGDSGGLHLGCNEAKVTYATFQFCLVIEMLIQLVEFRHHMEVETTILHSVARMVEARKQKDIPRRAFTVRRLRHV